MMPRYLLPLVALLLCGSEIALGGNILALPADYSHWRSMLAIVNELVARNHSVTALTHSASPSIKFSQKDNFQNIVFQINMEEQEVQNILQNFMDASMNDSITGIRAFSLFWNMMSDHGRYLEAVCDGKPTTLCDTLGKADIWLIRTYWDFEYPRPLLPNFKFVGGLHCKPAKPLPKEMEAFVQSSGDDGIVVFSLGSMVKNLTKDRANTIASALGQIPQKVLWRYSGEKPDTLAPNTRLYDWIPQNDLLGHPKTKAFITHGGTNGLYEAIYHGVPMVGVPLFADQPDNLLHMKTKGAAVIVDFNKMETKDLKEALTEVITNPSYKESIMRLSRIHHDQPMKPLDQAVFWIEFVMRNKGAKHLRVEAHNLTWYQYHCLDVAAFLLSVVALVVFIFVKTCKWLFCKCCRRSSSSKSKRE
ncbi:UDP-glucuronosyltransferase 2A1-like isoform X8 [Salminus brasiliensis]|uniref:UDP-glucuronosyltransferase 2A1-like isoform X8 n=1 Tax=Salminus brasiliensis TaxID=930266 RepID=UPI003B839FE6